MNVHGCAMVPKPSRPTYHVVSCRFSCSSTPSQFQMGGRRAWRPWTSGGTLMSDSDLRPSCEHHHEEGEGHDPRGHGLDRAQLRASRRAFIKGVIASGVAVSSTGYLVLGRGTAHAQAAGAVGRLITLNVN